LHIILISFMLECVTIGKCHVCGYLYNSGIRKQSQVLPPPQGGRFLLLKVPLYKDFVFFFVGLGRNDTLRGKNGRGLATGFKGECGSLRVHL